MNTKEIEQEVMDMVSMAFQLPRAPTREVSLPDLGLDPFDLVEVVMMVEERFGVEDFEDVDFSNLSIADLAKEVEGRIP